MCMILNVYEIIGTPRTARAEALRRRIRGFLSLRRIRSQIHDRNKEYGVEDLD